MMETGPFVRGAFGSKAWNTVLLGVVPFDPDIESLASRLRVTPDNPRRKELDAMVRDAAAIAVPKAFYGWAHVEHQGDGQIRVEGETFVSRMLRSALGDAEVVLPFVATAGIELQSWAASASSPLHAYWSDVIMDEALRCALTALERHVAARVGGRKTRCIKPGIPADWPVTEQRKLFALLGNMKKAVGVELTDACLMIPLKTVSGLRFQTDSDVEGCTWCPQKNCRHRKNPP